jgi:FkbM family methyltransferase
MNEIVAIARSVNAMLFSESPLANETVEGVANELAATGKPVSATDIARAMLGRSNRYINPSSWQVQFSQSDILYHPFEGFELALDRCDHSVSVMIAHNAYERHMLLFFGSHVSAGMVTLDIGANIGLYTMQFARLVGPNGKVIAFEPNSENCRLLLLSTERNGFSNIELVPVALSDRRGAHLFTTAIGTNGSFTDQRHGVMSRGCTVVPTLPLDSLGLSRVDVMKLDVEGAEYLALRGGESVVEKFRPLVTTEFSLDMLKRISGVSGTDYFAWFTQRSYKPFLVPRDCSAPTPIEDVASFLATYGQYQIEDLAFFPK